MNSIETADFQNAFQEFQKAKINSAFDNNNTEQIKGKFFDAIKESDESLVHYIGMRVINEWSTEERCSFYANMLAYSVHIYKSNVSLGSCLVRLALDAGLNQNELMDFFYKWDGTHIPCEGRSLLSFIGEQKVDNKDRNTHLNLVLFLLFNEAVAIPALTEQAKKNFKESLPLLYPKTSFVFNCMKTILPIDVVNFCELHHKKSS